MDKPLGGGWRAEGMGVNKFSYDVLLQRSERRQSTGGRDLFSPAVGSKIFIFQAALHHLSSPRSGSFPRIGRTGECAF